MKPVITIAFLLFLLTNDARTQTGSRNVMWLNGPSPTSNLWGRAAFSTKAARYKSNDVSIWPYNNDNTAHNIPAWAGIFNDKLETENQRDVLGIGHDAGGLILRYMDMLQESDNLSAMILDGVPNQGGKIFNNLVPPTPNATSPAQDMVQQLLNLRTQAQGCVGCKMIEAAQGWFSFSFPNIQSYYQQLQPGSPVINNLEQPDIPCAVIWGNEDDDALTLTRLLSSKGNSGLFGEDNEYLDCYRKELEQRLITAEQNHHLAFLKRIAGFAGAVEKISKALTNPGAVIEAAIKTEVDFLRAQIDLSNELRKLFECELIHQALNAKWNLMVAPYTVQEETVTIPCIPCDGCEDDPDPQVVGYCYAVCNWNCDPALNTYTEMYTYLRYEPHDALLTQSEQLLGGAVQTYEAKGCNHLQEQFWEYSPVQEAFQDLFNGGAGAFVVPK